MSTVLKTLVTFTLSHVQAFLARQFSGKVVAAALVVGLIVGGLLF